MHLGLLRKKDGGISIGIEADTIRADVVEHDSVCPFAKKLLSRAGNIKSHLGRKRDEKRARTFVLRHAASDVFSRL